MNNRDLVRTSTILLAVALSFALNSTGIFGQNRDDFRDKAANADAVENTLSDTTAAAPADPQDPKRTIVGSWLVKLGTGSRIVETFNSDGTYVEAGQGDIVAPPDPNFPSFTAAHGVWEYAGHGKYVVTAVILMYNVNDGSTYLGQFKFNHLVTLSENGDQLTGTDRTRIIAPDGTVTDLGSTGTMTGARIKAEPFPSN
jgi:hypothetical protein